MRENVEEHKQKKVRVVDSFITDPYLETHRQEKKVITHSYTVTKNQRLQNPHSKLRYGQII